MEKEAKIDEKVYVDTFMTEEDENASKFSQLI